MPIRMTETDDGKLLEIQVTGKLVREDFQGFVPEFERTIQKHGKVLVFFEMDDFHGWDMAGLQDELKFDMKHFSDMKRVAMVGDKTWEKAIASLSRPFISAEIRYFDRGEIEAARQWLVGA